MGITWKRWGGENAIPLLNVWSQYLQYGLHRWPLQPKNKIVGPLNKLLEMENKAIKGLNTSSTRKALWHFNIQQNMKGITWQRFMYGEKIQIQGQNII